MDGAKEELKRADHSIYVTLKYTKTVDVIRNTIQRLISAFDYAIVDLSKCLVATKKMKEKNVPANKIGKAQDIIKRIPKVKEHMKTYLLLRKIMIAPEIKKREEYRKHVTLIAKMSPKEVKEVDIETLRHYFMKTGEFVEYVEEIKQKVLK